MFLDAGFLKNRFEDGKITERALCGTVYEVGVLFCNRLFMSDALVVHPNFEDTFRRFVFSKSLAWSFLCVGNSCTLENILINEKTPTLMVINAPSEDIRLS